MIFLLFKSKQTLITEKKKVEEGGRERLRGNGKEEEVYENRGGKEWRKKEATDQRTQTSMKNEEKWRGGRMNDKERQEGKDVEINR